MKKLFYQYKIFRRMLLFKKIYFSILNNPNTHAEDAFSIAFEDFLKILEMSSQKHRLR